MSFRKDNAAVQTLFRTAARENGYSPLPNHDKKCFVKGWDKLQATPDNIEKWSSQLVYQATGLRVENGMCAIDIDVDDPELVERIWDRAAGQYPQLREALIRHGKGAKEMWVCRTDEQFSVIYSTSHVRPTEDPEEVGITAHRLEAFGGGHVRQIGASGAHTMKNNGSGFEVEYVWDDGESPAEVRLDALPLLPKSAILMLAEIASEELAAAKWPRITRSKSGESDLSSIYDLTPEMRFNCLDGETRSLDQLSDYAMQDNARCSGSWSGDASMINRTRCLISVDYTGVVCVLETANWERHLPASEGDRDKPLTDKMDELRAKMEDVGFEFDFDKYEDAPASFQDVTFKLLEDWAWCGSRSIPCLPIGRQEEMGQSFTNLKMSFLRHSYEQEGPRGGVTKVSPVDAWAVHNQRQDVDGYQFMPQHPQGIFTQNGMRAINSYRAPQHPIVAPDCAERAEHVQLWEDFMLHLLPADDEREWFCDWLAHKKQNLRVPAVGVIMYAAPFGVGRGTLFEFIGAIFGDEYVKSVTGDTLMGMSSQSQYTDWMANALFVTTDEVLPDGEEGTSMAWRRKKAYEKLKERIDPKPRRMEIIRKTLPNYQDWVYASFLLATNHNNAIPIPVGDRRLVVLTNRPLPLTQDPELKRRIDKQRNPDINLRFISCIADWLQARDVSHFDAHVAPDFEGKSQMQDANVSEIEGFFDDVLEAVPLDWCTLDVLLDRVENSLMRQGLKDSYPMWRRQATDHVKTRWSFLGRMYVDEARVSKRTVLARNPAGEEHFRGLDKGERATCYADMRKLDNVASAKLRALRAGLKVV